MKQIALIIVALCPVLAGQYLSHLLRKRVEMLEKIGLMFSFIESNLSFFATPSAELVQLLISKEELNSLLFLKSCDISLRNGDNFRDAWLNSLKSRKNTAFLNKKDVSLLRVFCNNFGTSDIKGEVSNCRFCRSILMDHLKEAEANKNKYGNVLSVLGYFLGVALIIMLY